MSKCIKTRRKSRSCQKDNFDYLKGFTIPIMAIKAFLQNEEEAAETRIAQISSFRQKVPCRIIACQSTHFIAGRFPWNQRQAHDKGIVPIMSFSLGLFLFPNFRSYLGATSCFAWRGIPWKGLFLREFRATSRVDHSLTLIIYVSASVRRKTAVPISQRSIAFCAPLRSPHYSITFQSTVGHVLRCCTRSVVLSTSL